ncbi:hypothetical protein [Rhabdothermincola sediminis]|uniref:hypothetical protein n=1 Tax=Rhabdothermincola sediminis TaxID=2751370 RepID=UPI001AA060B1|nr:hypothetical protein [Rhabdothermincola sediminis]
MSRRTARGALLAITGLVGGALLVIAGQPRAVDRERSALQGDRSAVEDFCQESSALTHPEVVFDGTGWNCAGRQNGFWSLDPVDPVMVCHSLGIEPPRPPRQNPEGISCE